MNHIQEMRESDLVQEKDLGNGIHSFNFTRKCFNKKQWNNMTTKARGLFIDTANNNKVIARSFDKFFAIGERPETQLDYIMQHIEYPVIFYQKYNGFLGILSAGKNGHLFAASKSTDAGEYAEYFKTILMRHLELYDINENELYHYLKDNDISLVFEVIDPDNDPHIVKYYSPCLVLLEGVYNTIDEFKHISYDELKQVSKKFDFLIKKIDCVAMNSDDFLSMLDKINSLKGIEGYVIEDSAGHMYKIKTSWYNLWKFYRWMMNRALLDKGPTTQMDEHYFNIIKNAVHMFIEDNGHEPKSVIELREFLENKADKGE